MEHTDGGPPRESSQDRIRTPSGSEPEGRERISSGSDVQDFAPPTALPQSPAQNAGKKEKGRVRFNSTAGDSGKEEQVTTPATEPVEFMFTPLKRPRQSLIRGSSYNSVLDNMDPEEDTPVSPQKAKSAADAHQRAQQWAVSAQGAGTEMLGAFSAGPSRRNSYDSDLETINSVGNLVPGIAVDGAPVDGAPVDKGQEAADIEKKTQETASVNAAAASLVRAHTRRARAQNREYSPDRIPETNPLTRLTSNPGVDGYFPASSDEGLPTAQRGNVLSHLLKLYTLQQNASSGGGSAGGSGYTTPGDMTPGTSGAATPTRRKWYHEKEKNRSQDTLNALIGASAKLSMDPSVKKTLDPKDEKAQRLDPEAAKTTKPKRPKHRRSPSSRFSAMISKNAQEEARITIHVADILKRQQYIIKLCRALMLFGAPTHRLEEYLNMAARVLEIQGQFLYIPGCMIISFDDIMTHTAEVKIVRSTQGVNLGKLKDAHEIYKEVLHDVISLDEAIARIDDVIKSKDQFHPYLRVIVYGFASATVAPFAFDGRLLDMPIAFILGCLVGVLQLVIAPKSDLYSNVFEIVAAVLTSFLSRAFGSIRGGELFCFSALAQSSIALILPGYLVLCSALELQAKSIVPGSIRMVYAIIYSLFLGFGITVGIALYGAMDDHAVSTTSCGAGGMNEYVRLVFVPLFAWCLTIINQAKWHQMPMMTGIAMAGYVVNFFSSKKFAASPQISNTFGAFSIGVFANLYSRLRHGVAAAAMLPAIFVQVPSGLAATGSLLSGLSTANQLTHSNQTVINGTSTVSYTPVESSSSDALNSVVFDVAASMIQIAIGITVGLFLAAIIVYPFGKRRSGLFSF